ncbi:MAG TPA: hypothetical protein VHX39_37530 [Acetobacteraceae bacterium]|nr:hypothetical protein [Acetobacteraceae bacterium]
MSMIGQYRTSFAIWRAGSHRSRGADEPTIFQYRQNLIYLGSDGHSHSVGRLCAGKVAFWRQETERQQPNESRLMAIIYVRTFDTVGGADVPGTGLRTGSPRTAIEHANTLNSAGSPPGHVTRILYTGSFVDDAFTELLQLAQEHGLQVDSGQE